MVHIIWQISVNAKSFIFPPHNAEYQNLQTEIKSCFEELLRVLPEPEQQENVNERLSGIIGTLEILLPRLTYRQVLKDVTRLKGRIGAE